MDLVSEGSIITNRIFKAISSLLGIMVNFSVAIMVLAFAAVCAAVPSVIPVNPVTGSLVVPVQQLPPRPYEFGFEFGDGLGMNQYRREVADGKGAVKGSYGYLDPLGVSRVVDYTADEDGYKAFIRTNEPGTLSQNSANVIYVVQPPPPAALAQGLETVIPKLVV